MTIGLQEEMDWHSWPKHWTPALFMPRWASRITLEIREAMIQHLQEISEEDAAAEGAERGFWDGPHFEPTDDPNCGHMDGFRLLWDCINAKRGHGWDENPLVWVIKFKLLTPDKEK